jgi:xanthine dehydrogenase molybdopterin-binding subunit B
VQASAHIDLCVSECARLGESFAPPSASLQRAQASLINVKQTSQARGEKESQPLHSSPNQINGEFKCGMTHHFYLLHQLQSIATGCLDCCVMKDGETGLQLSGKQATIDYQGLP